MQGLRPFDTLRAGRGHRRSAGWRIEEADRVRRLADSRHSPIRRCSRQWVRNAGKPLHPTGSRGEAAEKAEDASPANPRPTSRWVEAFEDVARLGFGAFEFRISPVLPASSRVERSSVEGCLTARSDSLAAAADSPQRAQAATGAIADYRVSVTLVLAANSP